jgi:hypothetical protein
VFTLGVARSFRSRARPLHGKITASTKNISQKSQGIR